jgi:hypothetical protein
MLFSELSRTKHINTLCRQDVECLNLKPGGTQNNYKAPKG